MTQNPTEPSPPNTQCCSNPLTAGLFLGFLFRAGSSTAQGSPSLYGSAAQPVRLKPGLVLEALGTALPGDQPSWGLTLQPSSLGTAPFLTPAFPIWLLLTPEQVHLAPVPGSSRGDSLPIPQMDSAESKATSSLPRPPKAF